MTARAGATPSTTRFELSAEPPFRLDLTVWALRRRPGNAIDRWDGTTYRRAAVIGDTLADIAAVQVGTPEAPRLDVMVTAAVPLEPAVARTEAASILRRMLGLDIDLDPFYRSTEQDPDLSALVQRFRGLKPPRFASLFEGLVNAVACQQLTLTFGIELLNRFAARYGQPAPSSAPGGYTFPAPLDIAELDPDALRALGFSRQKSVAIVGLAHHVERGTLHLDDISGLGDADATAALRALRGIGRWSAEYVLLRGLGRLQVFPGDDVGARNNLRRRLGISGPLDYEGVGRTTARWSPYSGLVYFHFLVAGIEESGWLDDGADS
ncbi:MAG: AlkA N-terminal domain-containing protein [Acidimicrobiia bacterium]